jgi:hypothetical protein
LLPGDGRELRAGLAGTDARMTGLLNELELAGLMAGTNGCPSCPAR